MSEGPTSLETPFEALVEAHSAEIFTYLCRILGETTEAEDCLQDTFLKAYRAYRRLSELRNPRAWLYRIATNTARTQLRRRRLAELRTMDLKPELPDRTPSVLDSIDHHQRLIAVAAAVEALPYKQRAALLMRKYQELAYCEIAAALDCSEAAARANVYQALNRLRALLAGNQDGEADAP